MNLAAGNFGQLPDEIITEILGNFIDKDEVMPFIATCRKIYKLWKNIINSGHSMLIVGNTKVPMEEFSPKYALWALIINGARDQFIAFSRYDMCKIIGRQIRNEEPITIKCSFIVGKMKKRRNIKEIIQFLKLGILSYYMVYNSGIVKCDSLDYESYKNNFNRKNSYVKTFKKSYKELRDKVKMEGNSPEFYTYSYNYLSGLSINIYDYIKGW